MAQESKWQYDPAEHRKKHCWHKPEAGFLRDGSHVHGKCPNTLSKEAARDLLDTAVYQPLEPGEEYPPKLWTVHEGVIYEAVPTRPGVYHGYPWRGRPGLDRLPRRVLAALTQMAEQKGYLREFKDWIKTYG